MDSVLEKAVKLGFEPCTAAMDKGYDGETAHLSCLNRGIQPVIPARSVSSAKGIGREPAIPSDFKRLTDLYTKRTAIEESSHC